MLVCGRRRGVMVCGRDIETMSNSPLQRHGVDLAHFERRAVDTKYLIRDDAGVYTRSRLSHSPSPRDNHPRQYNVGIRAGVQWLDTSEIEHRRLGRIDANDDVQRRGRQQQRRRSGNRTKDRRHIGGQGSQAEASLSSSPEQAYDEQAL